MQEIKELFYKDGFRLVMSTIHAGQVGSSWETDNKNRHRLLKGLGLAPESVRFVRQHHSKTVVCPEDWNGSPLTEADGLIAEDPDDCIAVTAADCMPVFLFDIRTGVRALLHSGWKGTGIAMEALAVMAERYGSRPADITAVLGPSIGACCYNVDRERAGLFASDWGESAVEYRSGQYFISLREANRLLLEKSGIDDIIDINLCTSCCLDYGSFRREGSDNFTKMFCLSYLNDGR